MKNYPAYVICIDGEPLQESDESITLYQVGDDSKLMERFMAIIYLSEDSSRVTIKKFQLVPHVFESSISNNEFKRKAQETKEIG